MVVVWWTVVVVVDDGGGKEEVTWQRSSHTYHIWNATGRGPHGWDIFRLYYTSNNASIAELALALFVSLRSRVQFTESANFILSI